MKPLWFIVLCKFFLNRIDYKLDFISNGIPILRISLKGKMSIGKNFQMNNGLYHNMIGRQQRCFFIIVKDGNLKIGDNVGMSGTAIVCWNRITIGNNVRIGGGTVIYDTDFHSLDVEKRTTIPEDTKTVKTSPIIIEDNVFVGANCTILKGVIIGKDSIIGASSVVSRNIPDGEIWAGNPICFIRKIKV